MKRLLTIVAIAAALMALAPAAAQAGRWEGVVQGLRCATEGKACPVDMEDPLAAMEPGFVLLMPDGTFYTLSNIDRAIMARHINERTAVEGTLNSKYHSIKANLIESWSGNGWRTTWSPTLERKLRDAMEWNIPSYLLTP